MDEAVWRPTCSEKDVDDETIKASPLFAALRANGGYSVGGKVMLLPDEHIIGVAREVWQQIWIAEYKKHIRDVFDALEADEGLIITAGNIWRKINAVVFKPVEDDEDDDDEDDDDEDDDEDDDDEDDEGQPF